MHEELSTRMATLLRTLPAKQREILVLRVMVGMSAEKTAVMVGSMPGAVRVSQHRALARLRVAQQRLEEQEQQSGQRGLALLEASSFGTPTACEHREWGEDHGLYSVAMTALTSSMEDAVSIADRDQ
jgi:hypothetical protein